MKFKQERPVGGELVFANVIDEKLPVRWRPGAPVAIRHSLDAMKAGEKADDEIEFVFRDSQWLPRRDAVNNSLDPKQANDVAKNWFLVRVDPDRVVTELLRDEKKVTGAAAKIENPPRWGAVEREVLRASTFRRIQNVLSAQR